MNIKILPKKRKPNPQWEAESLDDAYEKGYFSESISREKLLRILRTLAPRLLIVEGIKEAGVYHPSLGYVCTVPYTAPRIPKWDIVSSIPEEQKKVLAGGWQKIGIYLEAKKICKERDFLKACKNSKYLLSIREKETE